MGPDTQQRIDISAIRAATDQLGQEVKGIKRELNKVVSLITGFRDADISAEAARLATLKGESKEVKNKYTPE